MSGFGPPPGAPAEETRRRPPAYLPPGGLATVSTAPVDPAVPVGMPPGSGGLTAPGSAEAAAAGTPARRGGGGVVRGPDRVLLVTSHKPGIISLVGGVAVGAWSAVLLARTCLAGAAVVLERRGVFDALSRSWSLTRGVFWRTLMRLVVVALLCGVVFWVVQLPLLLVSSLLGAILSLSPSLDAMVSSLGLAVATLLSMTVVVPFAAGALSLLYVDQRMRLEGFDLVLQRAARATGNGS